MGRKKRGGKGNPGPRPRPAPELPRARPTLVPMPVSEPKSGVPQPDFRSWSWPEEREADFAFGFEEEREADFAFGFEEEREATPEPEPEPDSGEERKATPAPELYFSCGFGSWLSPEEIEAEYVKMRPKFRTVYKREPKPMPAYESWPWSGSKVEVDYSKIEFVMRGVRFARDGIGYNGMSLHRNEYYKVYLENDEFVAKPLCESQLSSLVLAPSVMHRCGSRIYNISTLLMVDVNSIPNSLPLQGETIHCHNGISWFDLNDKTSPKKWHSASSHELLYKLPLQFAVLDNKIHCLTADDDTVDDTTLDSCQIYKHQLPDHLSEYEVSGKMIPEPRNKRILVHLTHPQLGSPLYAWHPTTNRWYSITTDIDETAWTDGSPILVDGVLYFYMYHSSSYFLAFDLGSNKWLHVVWPTRLPPLAARVKTDTLFYLGDGLVCLPASRRIFTHDPEIDEWGACVHFAIFHFRRTATPDGEPVVIFTHLFTKTVDVEHLVDIVDFLTLF